MKTFEDFENFFKDPDVIPLRYFPVVSPFHEFYSKNKECIAKLVAWPLYSGGEIYLSGEGIDLGVANNYSGEGRFLILDNVPVSVFSGLGFKEGDLVRRLLAFFDLRDKSMADVYISRGRRKQLGRKDYRRIKRELDEAFPDGLFEDDLLTEK